MRMCPSMGVAVCAKIELGSSTISNTILRVIYVVNEMQGLDDSSRFPYHCVKNASHGKSIKMSPQVPINGFTKLLMHLEGFLS